MSGIAALFTRDDPRDLETRLTAMLDAQTHRGPDGASVEVLAEEGVALGVRHLGVVAVKRGLVWDEAHRRAVLLDGRLFNSMELRRDLAAAGRQVAPGDGDSDLVLHAYAAWGAAMLPRLNGAFALAIWDREERRLFVADDRAGEKPLHVARLADGYAVASEMRAFLTLPGFDRSLDASGLSQYLTFRSCAAPRTLLRDVQRLPGASSSYVTEAGMAPVRYWRLGSEQRPWRWPDLTRALDEAFDRAIERRVAPGEANGVFLSGGLDSGTIAYYLKRHAASVEAFTLAYDDDAFDETEPARLIASHLGLRHRVEVMASAGVSDVFESYVGDVDEPETAGSALSRYHASRLARGDAGVTFGGDCGDELTLAYSSLVQLNWRGQGLRRLLPRNRTDESLQAVSNWGSAGRLYRARRAYVALRAPSPYLALAALNSFETAPTGVLDPALRPLLPASPYDDLETLISGIEARHPDAPEQTLATAFVTYLQNDTLNVVDRTAMSASLDLRQPMVDPDLMALIASVPAAMKNHRGVEKYPLRLMLHGKLPDAIIDREKHGFLSPMAAWMRGPLKPALLDRLDPVRLRAGGVFDPAAVTRILDQHLSGAHDNHVSLRTILMFEAWRQRWLGDVPVKAGRPAKAPA